MLLIRYENRVVATVTRRRMSLAPNIEVLEVDHPVRRWCVVMAAFAQQVLAGDMPGPYSTPRACFFARVALLPDEEFCVLADLPDAQLAEIFNVPLPEIAEKREDLRALAIF